MLKTISAVLVGLATVATPAAAQQWPTGPVTMIIPFAAGGPTDVLGRSSESASRNLSASRS